MPFSDSSTVTTFPFQIIHCDLWTPPVPSCSGYKYYLIIMDDFSHYTWTFPLRAKSDAPGVLHRFFQFVLTQFRVFIQCMQCDNGGEFLNSSLCSFLGAHCTSLRLLCPHTSPQNGKAERDIHSTNDIVRTLLSQAHMPPKFWVEGLHTSTYLPQCLSLTRHPTEHITLDALWHAPIL